MDLKSAVLLMMLTTCKRNYIFKLLVRHNKSIRILTGETQLFLIAGVIETGDETALQLYVGACQERVHSFGRFGDIFGNGFIPFFFAVVDAHIDNTSDNIFWNTEQLSNREKLKKNKVIFG